MISRFILGAVLCISFSLLSNAQSNDSLALEIPNIFTPNNDQVNDVFNIKSDNLTSLSIAFYNRWGQQVAQLNGIRDHWDGHTPSGDEVPEGSYFYILEAELKSGEKVKKSGVVTLVR